MLYRLGMIKNMVSMLFLIKNSWERMGMSYQQELLDSRTKYIG